MLSSSLFFQSGSGLRRGKNRFYRKLFRFFVFYHQDIPVPGEFSRFSVNHYTIFFHVPRQNIGIRGYSRKTYLQSY
jgi:hypothetical protein